jgi:diadenylate cyclase
MGEKIRDFLNSQMNNWYIPDLKVTDFIEILIIAFLVYHLIIWVKNTKAWMLLKGIGVLAIFILIAAILKMNTILWIAKNSIGVLATAAIIVFQPELRRALEKLGQKDFLSAFLPFEKSKNDQRFGEETIKGILNACYEMSKAKTGALIVVERDILLNEYQRTGIAMDCIVSEQILENIFEHNTPLHDGAVIVRGDRIVSATCYLPLTENMDLSKQLGTRHRAAIGMSEVSDALVICVSEETGNVSYAQGGNLNRNITREELRKKLEELQVRKSADGSGKKFTLKKGRRDDEERMEE